MNYDMYGLNEESSEEASLVGMGAKVTSQCKSFFVLTGYFCT